MQKRTVKKAFRLANHGQYNAGDEAEFDDGLAKQLEKQGLLERRGSTEQVTKMIDTEKSVSVKHDDNKKQRRGN